MNTPTPTRRTLLRAALGGLALLPMARLSFAAPRPGLGGSAGGRVVWILLRGGLDGLWAVPAPGDPNFVEARGALGTYAQAPLKLDTTFALHPALTATHALFTARQLAVVHAVSSPYRERSHFDAQQVLESGGTRPFALDTGWLGRAVQRATRRAVALAPAAPLSLRGAREVETWSPSLLDGPDDDLIVRLARIYAGDPMLAEALGQARRELERAQAAQLAEADAMGAEPEATGAMAGDVQARKRAALRGNPVVLAERCVEFFETAEGPTVAMLELSGWDSHAQQAAENGRLTRNLKALDATLGALATGLGDRLDQTVVVVASEFGRAVRTNGTLGTDHGTGGVCLVMGGGVRGGRVHGDWPGLAPPSLYEGRDLTPTTDLRAVLKAALQRQLGLTRAALDTEVFPESKSIAPLEGLYG